MKKGLNVVENNKISLKPVKELFGMNFFIPDYQRGYRWGTKQVEDLLRDLEEFYESICEAESSKIIYCLQPLVVMEKDNKYIVIDGQHARTHKNELSRIANSIRYADKMPPDFSAVLLKDYMYIEKDFKQTLMTIPEFSKWLHTKGSLMNGSVR